MQVPPGSKGVSKYWQEGPQSPPSDAPAEYQYGTSVIVTPTASFVSDSRAVGEVNVSYFGTSAVAEVTLTVYKGESTIGSAEGYREKTDPIPWQRNLLTNTSFVVSGTCGYRSNVYGRGQTWIGWGGAEWGKQGDSQNTEASQPGCSGGGGGGGGGGDGYVMVICETTEFYSGSGEYLGSSQECRTEEMM
jgi:hypothetical protein